MTNSNVVDLSSDGVRDQVYERLLYAMQAGRFLPGQKLTIRALAKELGTSPTPVRESLQRLAAEGVLIAEVNRSTRVPRLNGSQIRELRDIRLALETLAARRAVGHVSTDLIATLRQMNSDLQDARAADNLERDLALVYEFQFALYEASRMPQLTSMIRNLWLRSGPYLRALYPNYVSSAYRWRDQLILALENRDEDGVERELKRDIVSSLSYIADVADAATSFSGNSK